MARRSLSPSRRRAPSSPEAAGKKPALRAVDWILLAGAPAVVIITAAAATATSTSASTAIALVVAILTGALVATAYTARRLLWRSRIDLTPTSPMHMQLVSTLSWKWEDSPRSDASNGGGSGYPSPAPASPSPVSAFCGTWTCLEQEGYAELLCAMELPWPVRMAAESLSSPPDPTFSLSDDGVLHSYVRTFAGVMSESYPEGGTQRQKAPLTGDEVVSTFHWEGASSTTAVTVVGKPDVTTHRRWVASPRAADGRPRAWW